MKILIFGYGNRVKSCILFAIQQAINAPEVSIVTKNSKPDKLTNKNIKFYTFNEFKKLHREYFDLTVLSVPHNEQIKIFKILDEKNNKKVLIDTPVNKKVKKMEKRYDIGVLEDIIHSPIIHPINELIQKEKNINFNFYKSAHEYHGVAMVESLLGNKIINKKRKFIDDENIILYLKINKSHNVVITSPSDTKNGYINIKFNDKNYLLGNKDNFQKSEKIKSDQYIRVEELFPLKKIDGNVSENWVEDLGDFKLMGLIKIFNNLDQNISQNIYDSFRQQKIAKTNRFEIKLKRTIYNIIYGNKQRATP